jgi:hypothetical protein
MIFAVNIHIDKVVDNLLILLVLKFKSYSCSKLEV